MPHCCGRSVPPSPGTVRTLLRVSCFQEFVNQLGYPSVLDFIVQQAYKNGMVDIVKASFDVAFDKPTRTVELPSQLL